MISGLSGLRSILRRSRMMRRSIERSKTSQPRLCACSMIWSRLSGRFGCRANSASRSNSAAVIAISYARQQLAQVERLGHVVVGAELESDDAVDRFALGGQHHQRHAGMVLSQPARQRQAVLARHVDVEDDEVRMLRVDDSARLRGVDRGMDDEALTAEVFAEQRAQ